MLAVPLRGRCHESARLGSWVVMRCLFRATATPSKIAQVGAGRKPESIEMMQVDVSHRYGSARFASWSLGHTPPKKK